MTLLNHYLTPIWRALPFLIFTSLLAALLAYGLTARLGPTYESHFSYLISLSEREPAPDFRFDGYYAISAIDLFAGTLAAQAQAPEVIVRAHAAANLPLAQPSPRQLSRIVRAQKAAPQLVHLTVRATSRQTAQALTTGLQTVINENLIRYQQDGIPQVKFRVVSTEPWIGVEQPATKIVMIATLVAVFLLGLNTVMIQESLRR